MRHLKTQNYLSFFLITLFLSLACSDTGSNIEEEIAPEIPNLSEGIPEFDFFMGKVSSSIEQTAGENFVIASSLASAVEAIMISFSTIPTSFTASAEGVEATYNNGIWEWSYTSSGAGASVTIRLTAEVKIIQTNWAMYLSASNEETSFDNYKFIDGFVKNSSNSGEWNFYAFEEESTTPVMNYTWDIESETEATFAINFEESSFSSLTYVKDLPDNTLTITDEASSSSIIYWNSTTGTGYVETSGQGQVCWDENGDNVACPS